MQNKSTVRGKRDGRLERIGKGGIEGLKERELREIERDGLGPPNLTLGSTTVPGLPIEPSMSSLSILLF